MASLKTRDIRAALTTKGFIEDPSRDHIWLNYVPEGKKTRIRTKISHGKDSIGDPLISAMAKQTKINKNDFVDLVSCTLSGKEYYDKVKKDM